MATKNFEPDPAVIMTTTVTSKTTTTTTTSGSTPLSLDRGFLSSPQGILTVLEMVYSLVAFIVVAASNRIYYSGSFAFFLAVTFILFFFTVCSYVGQCTHLRYKIQAPWTMIDMGVYSTYIILLIISSSLVAARGYEPGHGSGATLGFVLMQFYVISLGLSFMQYRATKAMNQQSSGAMGADNAGSTIGAGSSPDAFDYAGSGPV